VLRIHFHIHTIKGFIHIYICIFRNIGEELIGLHHVMYLSLSLSLYIYEMEPPNELLSSCLIIKLNT
jgi:hypothetical protein